MARRGAALLPLLLAACLLSGALRSAFVPAPGAGRQTASAAALAAATLAPAAAYADLPPLEELPLDQMSQTREYGPQSDTFLGISFPVMLVGLVFAVSWAAFWVSTSKPAKDDEGMYKTYIGGGELPPEGYTNPLDPRMSEDYALDDDEGAPSEKKLQKQPASSAIV